MKIPQKKKIVGFPSTTAIVESNVQKKNHSEIWFHEFSSAAELDSLSRIIPHDVRSNLDKIFNKNINSKIVIEVKDDKNAWYEWKLIPQKDELNLLEKVFVIAENITNRKREEELHIKVENVSGIGGWEVDLVNNKLFWNETTKLIHEVPLSYVPNLEEGINFYKEGEHRERIANIVTETIKNGGAWDEELQITTATGKDIWVRAKGEAEIVNAVCVRIFGTFQNIDKQVKERLYYKNISDRLALATSSSGIGIWEYNLYSSDMLWDDNMFSIYNIDKSTTKDLNKNWIESLHPDDRERCIKEREASMSGIMEHNNSEHRIIWPNKEIRYIKSSYSLQKNKKGLPDKLIGLSIDITELKKTQLKLSKNEESFKGAFENSAIGMALVGLDGTWLDVNKTICRSLGYTAEELIGDNFMKIAHKSDIVENKKTLAQFEKNEIQELQTETKYIHKNGSIVNALLTITAIKNYREKTTHLLVQVVDITYRIEAEIKTKNLITITKSQNRSLLNFAHIVSHNLRSHSTNLSMLTSFLNEETDKEEREEIERMLVGASKSLNESVHHLNEVVQITTSVKDKSKKVNVLTSINNVRNNINQLLKEKDADLNINIPSDLEVIAVPAYLDSILLNLFTNSIKYSSPTRKLHIDVDYKSTGNKTILHFSDNGIGIDMERHGKKLFGMYKTFHKHKDAKGIGLFITKNQIEAMGGTIKVESEVDKGTTFILTFLNKKPK